MNYKILNNAIIRSEDIPLTLSRDKKFYRYLLNNNIAYYYSRYLCKKKGKHEKNIIQAGNRFNLKYIKTLRLIITACTKQNIEFSLFKTFKPIPEAVDGDIDLFIKERDFPTFLNLLEKEGFTCREDERQKAFCNKRGFCDIEPRVNISFHGKIILGEEIIWKNTEEVFINELKLKKTTKELDLFFMLMNVLYGPNYFKLYSYLVFRNLDLKKIYALAKDETVHRDLEMLIHSFTTNDVTDTRFPLFPADIIFLKWWLERSKKVKHILFFIYAKYGYKFFNTLPFRHDWRIKDV